MEEKKLESIIFGLKAEIERLQGENKSLKSELKKECDEHIDFVKEADKQNRAQKAEIERLKKRHGVALLRNDDLDLENYELKKQVDELTAKLGKVLSTVGLDEYQQSQAVQQAVKDTAEEALEAFICRLVNLRLVSTKGDLYVKMLEAKDDLLKEKYGVEKNGHEE